MIHLRVRVIDFQAPEGRLNHDRTTEEVVARFFAVLRPLHIQIVTDVHLQVVELLQHRLLMAKL